MKTTRLYKAFAFVVATVGMSAFMACNPEPDESDLYTATGETAADFIKRKSNLSAFDQILQVVGLDRNLSAWGEYTCFVPNNEAIDAYIQKLWNDPEAFVEHNGLTAPTLEALLESDSLCNSIAKYHLTSGVHTTIEIGGGGTQLTSLLGEPFQTSTDSLGFVRLELSASIIEPDSIVTNGIVHVIDSVIPRNNRLLSNELDHHPEYSIFVQALKLTGLDTKIVKVNKGRKFEVKGNGNLDPDGKTRYWWPDECKIMYTIFAEPNSVMASNGINNINDLIAFANEQYGSAADWYDYLNETGNTVSTGTDYTNPFNALNMFVAYHILYAGMPQNELVWENESKWNTTWNYINGATPFDYYETMLPNTILKIWQPQGNQLFINRWVRLNTLTDEIGTMGSAAMHPLERAGVRIFRTTDSDASKSQDDHSHPHTSVKTYNGYIHALRSMLVYDRDVPKGVLHERMRFDATTFMVEFINNGIRMATQSQIQTDKNGGGSGSRVTFPLDYFDNMVSYSDQNVLAYNVKGPYNAWQSDTFQGWGTYDLGIKLPHVPSGNYEFRLYIVPMGHGSMMQYYMGNSSKLSSMQTIDLPYDSRIPITDPRIGWTNFNEEEDRGIATDAVLRTHGYMRGPYSYKDHKDYNDDDLNATTRNLRYTSTNNNGLRKILGRFNIHQSQDYWFRIKTLLPDNSELKWQFDYIELVPVDVVDNEQYLEDWY